MTQNKKNSAKKKSKSSSTLSNKKEEGKDKNKHSREGRTKDLGQLRETRIEREKNDTKPWNTDTGNKNNNTGRKKKVESLSD